MKSLLLILAATSFQTKPLHEHPTLIKMLKANNELRKQSKLPVQSLSPKLTKAAQNHAVFMAKTHNFSHYANTSPGKRAAKYKYDGIVIENIGRAYKTIPDVFKAWQNSPKHWKALTEKENTDVGMGYAIAKDGTQYWVALYGKPRKWLKNPQKLGTSLPPALKQPPKVSTKSLPVFDLQPKQSPTSPTKFSLIKKK